MEQRRRHRDKLLFLMFAGAIGIMLLVIGGYQLIEFTDSTAFCGRLCHQVMYPEYTAYQASPHSRVACTECHVGKGADYLVKSKVRGVPQLFSVMLNRLFFSLVNLWVRSAVKLFDSFYLSYGLRQTGIRRV